MVEPSVWLWKVTVVAYVPGAKLSAAEPSRTGTEAWLSVYRMSESRPSENQDDV